MFTFFGLHLGIVMLLHFFFFNFVLRRGKDILCTCSHRNSQVYLIWLSGCGYKVNKNLKLAVILLEICLLRVKGYFRSWINQGNRGEETKKCSPLTNSPWSHRNIKINSVDNRSWSNKISAMRNPNYRSYFMAHLGALAYFKIKFESHSNNFKTLRKNHYY